MPPPSMQWLIDIISERILIENPNLAALNAISPTDSVFAHGTGATWEGVTGSGARDALALGVADDVEFGSLSINDLFFQDNIIDSDTGHISFATNHLEDIRTISALEIFSPTIHCNTLDVDDIQLDADIEADNYTSSLHLGFSGPGQQVDIRNDDYSNLTIRKVGAARCQLGWWAQGGFLNLTEDNNILAAQIRATPWANVQAWFLHGRVGIGTSTPYKMLDVAGDISLESGGGDYYSNDGSQGWSGTFTEHGGKTVTVKNGIITGVV